MGELPQIDRVLKAATDRGDVPGAVAMAATREGSFYQGAFGKRALPDGAAMTTDTVFWIASMTKAITSTAAMQLVEAGKLSLDRPIAEALPELAAPHVLEGFDAAGEPKLRPARQPITLRHLITPTLPGSSMTSGARRCVVTWRRRASLASSRARTPRWRCR
jgi:CubicO group peptidase (beta-lactamase class C family)